MARSDDGLSFKIADGVAFWIDLLTTGDAETRRAAQVFSSSLDPQVAARAGYAFKLVSMSGAERPCTS